MHRRQPKLRKFEIFLQVGEDHDFGSTRTIAQIQNSHRDLVSCLEVGAGELMVHQAIVRLSQQMNLIKPLQAR
jgi:hypothetical protein